MESIDKQESDNVPTGDASAHEIEQSPEARRIDEGIAEALRDGTAIDHETAWLIASAITPGSGPLHQLALTGEVSADIGADLEVAYEVLRERADTWIAALDGYCFRRRDKRPVPGWPRLDQDQPADDDGDTEGGEAHDN